MISLLGAYTKTSHPFNARCMAFTVQLTPRFDTGGYGLAICPFTYLMGHLFPNHVKAQIYTILFNLMSGIILMIMSYV